MKITQEILNVAMKKAVALELIPKHSDEATYLKYWEGMKLVLEVAFHHIEKDEEPIEFCLKEKTCDLLQSHRCDERCRLYKPPY